MIRVSPAGERLAVPPYARVVAVINFKGGVGKTTSLAYLLQVWARLGLRTAGVDADKQGSLLRGAGLAGWSMPVLGLPTPTLHRQIFGVSIPTGAT